jgi:hypothetical protein
MWKRARALNCLGGAYDLAVVIVAEQQPFGELRLNHREAVTHKASTAFFFCVLLLVKGRTPC